MYGIYTSGYKWLHWIDAMTVMYMTYINPHKIVFANKLTTKVETPMGEHLTGKLYRFL